MKQHKVIKKIGKRFVPGNIVDELTFSRFSKEIQRTHFTEVTSDQPKKAEKAHIPKVQKVEEKAVVETTTLQAEPKQISRWKKEIE